MADNIVDILIRFGLNKDQATQAVGEINKIKTATTDAGKEGVKQAEAGSEATKEQTRHIGGMHKALNLLEHQFGDLGRIIGFAFRHPLAAATAAAAIGLQKINERTVALEETLKNLANSSGHALGDMAGSLREGMLQFIASNNAFKESQEDMQTAIDKAIKKIEAQRDATLILLAAQKALALANATNDEEKAAIEKRFGSAEDAAKQKSADEVLAAKEKQLNADLVEQKRQQLNLQRLLKGESRELAEAELKNIPKQRTDLLEEKQVIKEAQKILQENLNSPAGTVSLLKTFGTVQGIKDYKASLDRRAVANQSALGGLDTNEERLTRGIAAFDASKQLGRKISGEQADVDALRTRANAGRTAAAISQFGAPAEMILNAAAGSDAIRAGGKATAEQKQAIAAAAQAFGLVGQNSATIIAMLSRMNDNQTAFQNSLKTLQARLNQLPHGS